MAKLTLLEMTQNILTAMDSDEVNDISATVESNSVAEFIKEAYFSIISERDWPFLRTLTTLESAVLATPTSMAIPETLNKVLWIKYNKKDVTYLTPKDFKTLTDSRPATTGVVDSNGYVINADPLYWTTFDDNTVVFDGYNLAVESNLQTSKCVVFGVTAPTWSMTNSFVPLLPDKFFPTLLAEAKATSFLNIKQQGNNREEMKARRGRTHMQNEAWKTNDSETTSNKQVNYGRK